MPLPFSVLGCVGVSQLALVSDWCVGEFPGTRLGQLQISEESITESTNGAINGSANAPINEPTNESANCRIGELITQRIRQVVDALSDSVVGLAI